MRGEGREDVGARDGVDALRANRFEDLRERREPLLAVLVALERCGVRGVDGLGRIFEAQHGSAFLPSLREGVAGCAGDAPESPRFFAPVGERHQFDTAETNVAAPTLHDGSQHPAFRAARCHEQIQPAAIGVATWLSRGADGACRQGLVRMSSCRAHWLSLVYSHRLCGSKRGSQALALDDLNGPTQQ